MKHDETLPERALACLADDTLAIFLIHGVIERQRHRVRNYTGKHMDADLFTRCMKRLSEEGRALSMDDVLNHCAAGTAFPRRSFAITFDDGFENNIRVALPIMRDYDIPAMIYITSG